MAFFVLLKQRTIVSSVPLLKLSPTDESLKRLNEKLRRELGNQICQYLAEPDVIEILLNPDGQLWVEYFGQDMTPFGQMPCAVARSIIDTVASSLDTRVNRENPILECELPLDGSRFEGLIPPVVSAPTFSIRRKASKVFTLANYVQSGIMTEGQKKTLEQAVETKKNILVVGGTGSGKTTLTNALIHHMVQATPEDRLVIIEDTAEVQCAAQNSVLLRATDLVEMQRLLKATMRLRPDRILVGEVRGQEALTLLKAWNTGHPGGIATVHANSAYAGLIRLEQLIAEATQANMQKLIGEAVDLLVFITKTAFGRKIQEIISVEKHDGQDYVYTIRE